MKWSRDADSVPLFSQIRARFDHGSSVRLLGLKPVNGVSAASCGPCPICLGSMQSTTPMPASIRCMSRSRTPLSKRDPLHVGQDYCVVCVGVQQFHRALYDRFGAKAATVHRGVWPAGPVLWVTGRIKGHVEPLV